MLFSFDLDSDHLQAFSRFQLTESWNRKCFGSLLDEYIMAVLQTTELQQHTSEAFQTPDVSAPPQRGNPPIDTVSVDVQQSHHRVHRRSRCFQRHRRPRAGESTRGSPELLHPLCS